MWRPSPLRSNVGRPAASTGCPAAVAEASVSTPVVMSLTYTCGLAPGRLAT